MSGIPITIVTSGGVPVTESTCGAPYVEATNGLGLPVRFVNRGGLPLTKGVPVPPAGSVLWTETVDGITWAYYEVIDGVRYYLTRPA